MNDNSFAINKGVAILDSKRPEWLDEIDFTILDMDSTTTCILGQLYGSYSEGKAQLNMGFQSGEPYGFAGGFGSMSALTSDWKKMFLPAEGDVYYSVSSFSDNRNYAKIHRVVGLGNTTRIICQMGRVNYTGEFTPSVERAYITRKVSAFRRDWKKNNPAPKPGAFLQADDGTRFFVAPDGRLWTLNAPTVAWVGFEAATRKYGTLSPIKTAIGAVFTAEYTA